MLRELGIDGRIENPYWDKTKGEMTAACVNSTLLKTLVTNSLSCSSHLPKLGGKVSCNNIAKGVDT